MIRAFDGSDLDVVLDVWYRASSLAHPFLDASFFEEDHRAIETVYLPNAETWVYVEGGRVVGFISLVGNEVGGLFVDPAYHGRGIGRALMDHARSRRDVLELDVFEANAIGRRFYDRYGFVRVGEHVHEATGYPQLRLRLVSDQPYLRDERGSSVSVTPLAPTVFEGQHVRLEPLALDHLDALCAVGLDPDLWQWIPTPICTRDDLTAYILAALEGQERGEMLPFATVERASGTVIGSTRYGNVDLANRRVEIGWTWVARPWQRTAVNTEAKLLMLRHAFGPLGCHRVEFKTDALNERSRRAILRLGAVEEGTLRKHIVTASGRVRDTVYFSITDDDWPRVEARLEHLLARSPSSLQRPPATVSSVADG